MRGVEMKKAEREEVRLAKERAVQQGVPAEEVWEKTLKTAPTLAEHGKLEEDERQKWVSMLADLVRVADSPVGLAGRR